MTDEQARHIWAVLLELSGQKGAIIEIRPSETAKKEMEERRQSIAG